MYIIYLEDGGEVVPGEEEGGRGEEYDHERIMTPIIAMSSARSRITFGLFLPTVCPMPSFTLSNTIHYT